MCGITGYVGKNNAIDFLISGLEKLEYRGYDSAGICVTNGSALKLCKTEGRISVLKEKVFSFDVSGKTGIGHTRWATHGMPNHLNSHPHLSNDKKFAVVHNGIIENYSHIKRMLADRGFEFASETDTEIIPNLLQYYYNGDVFDAFAKTVECLEGSYALGVVSAHQPDTLFAVRKDSPLIVGLGDNENYLASDIPAILPLTQKIYILESGEFAIITKDDVKIVNSDKKIINKEIFKVTWNIDDAKKDGYDFYMLKEITEQPEAVMKTILPRIKNEKIDLSELLLDDEFLKKLERIHIVACGSAFHAAVMGKDYIEGISRTAVSAELASEFRYKNPIINKNDLVIIISQSGETSDTLAALRYAKGKGNKILSIVNVRGSSIARESDYVLYTHAGPEIAVATTKAYLTQLYVLMLFAIYLAELKDVILHEQYLCLINDMIQSASQIKKLLSKSDYLNSLAQKFIDVKDVFYIGRGVDNSLAMEGSLKLKEISYIHSESYAAGELKHGTISLIEDGTLVVALCTQKKLFGKMLSNIKEVKARGAYVIAIGTEDMNDLETEADNVIFIPKTNEYLAAALAVIPLQLFAYYISLHKGFDVDKPRNLAKSVTVE
ncbi:MAG: glutamine--fructose-6-phosphate transaminase (isomerizing) [Clostridia bacterium]|nr:glutamine--fructose-6-phosphate transaminase (isomerizing) [Clostridia bacterium]